MNLNKFMMNFNSDSAKNILIEVLKSMNSPDNFKKIADAKGKDEMSCDCLDL